jgi:hypothetical protein
MAHCVASSARVRPRTKGAKPCSCETTFQQGDTVVRALLSGVLVAHVIVISACTGSIVGSNGSAAVGSAGEPCYADGSCDRGLTCNPEKYCQTSGSNPCQGVTCSTHGACTVASGNALCACDDGYTQVGLTCVADRVDGGAPTDGVPQNDGGTPHDGNAAEATAPASCGSLDAAPVSVNPPRLLPIGDRTATEGTSLRFTVVATDADDNPVSYSACNLPSGAGFSPLPTQEIFRPYSSGAKFSWTPSSSQVGTHTLCFSASDGASSTSECISIAVSKNYLLHPSDCPSGSVVRGDGACTENVKRVYGADAKPTSDPLGGGVGYSAIVDPVSADFTVSTRSELLNALDNAVSGQIVYVTDGASIDLTGDQDIAIPAGVTLASGRGRDRSLGALIYSDALETYPLFTAAGEGVRVTGLRLQGPDPDKRTEQMKWLDAQGLYYDIPNSYGITSQYSHLTVDNCELFGWSFAAIEFERYDQPGTHDNHIHHNYIHHNQRDGLGYGVSMNGRGGSDALIEVNVFDFNRHSVQGTRGTPTASYEARYNLVADGFDMHGGNDISDASVPAGGYVKAHHNTFWGSDLPAVGIRGIPTEGVWVYGNWAVYNLDSYYTTATIFSQSLNNLPGHTPYEKMWVDDNYYGVDPPAADTP